ncbi:hypothetical protein SYNPS1DRAFT_26914 [Syncephalis pseudoplumigaleata]|uniref:Uncharacterized protein n=1 Tax=Syncephalis pseudoplumigaleata TaxID=1712513 RepID=A0A4P9Z5R9_9FUNG|nr:hypothetical protein SYNPS1DRAFT_26914 [Syncephalis pseudoplumigaleata]|eukprot:RKP27432.1 hypothetical protein SYNPS1DRAFT_26914 [Syncephalis pseudoplumigaleata]
MPQNRIRAKRPFALMAQKTASSAVPLCAPVGSSSSAPPSDHRSEASSKAAAPVAAVELARKHAVPAAQTELHQLPALLRAQKLMEAEQRGEVNIEASDLSLGFVMNDALDALDDGNAVAAVTPAQPLLKQGAGRPGIFQHKRRSQSVSAVMNAHTSRLEKTARDAPPQAHDPDSLAADAACFEHVFSSYADWAKSTFAGAVSGADPGQGVPRKDSILASSRQRLQREQQQQQQQQKPRDISPSSSSLSLPLPSAASASASVSSSSSPLASASSSAIPLHRRRRRRSSLSAPTPIPVDKLQPAMAQSCARSPTGSAQWSNSSPLRAVCSPRSPASRLRSSSLANPTIHFCLLRIVLSARDYITIRVPTDISLSNLTHMVINKCLRCGRRRDDLKHRLFIWERSDPDLTLGVVNDTVLREVLLPKPSSMLASEKYTCMEKPITLYWT